ncbi:unnamed protein product [Phyllotreta striolata]|uniref:Uncharacterized protein n=1 Tax=Phyllotreta striolata TaxID=444603 RepID=A0A9N9XR38_PHYSR|nr:unnamed protein product [Phyllotreta striolata]
MREMQLVWAYGNERLDNALANSSSYFVLLIGTSYLLASTDFAI